MCLNLCLLNGLLIVVNQCNPLHLNIFLEDIFSMHLTELITSITGRDTVSPLLLQIHRFYVLLEGSQNALNGNS